MIVPIVALWDGSPARPIPVVASPARNATPDSIKSEIEQGVSADARLVVVFLAGILLVVGG